MSRPKEALCLPPPNHNRIIKHWEYQQQYQTVTKLLAYTQNVKGTEAGRYEGDGGW